MLWEAVIEKLLAVKTVKSGSKWHKNIREWRSTGIIFARWRNHRDWLTWKNRRNCVICIHNTNTHIKLYIPQTSCYYKLFFGLCGVVKTVVGKSKRRHTCRRARSEVHANNKPCVTFKSCKEAVVMGEGLAKRHEGVYRYICGQGSNIVISLFCRFL